MQQQYINSFKKISSLQDITSVLCYIVVGGSYVYMESKCKLSLKDQNVPHLFLHPCLGCYFMIEMQSESNLFK